MLSFSRLGQVGRLGNQLFQVAFVTQFAKRHAASYKLPYWKYAEYFDYPFEFADLSQITFDEVIREPALGYNEEYFIKYLPQIYQANVNIITGYFQSYKYFKKPDIIELFKPSNKFKCPVIPLGKSVAISVRRGDFVKHTDYNDIGAGVFQDLLQRYFKQYTVFVFTDDYKYCKSEFNGNQFEFFDGLNDIEQLLALSKFKNFILSNSTFSYWGPMLNPSPEKIYYPYYMFPNLERCKLYNKDYWPQEDSIYQSYLNPINKFTLL